jgi:hypothetical protein
MGFIILTSIQLIITLETLLTNLRCLFRITVMMILIHKSLGRVGTNSDRDDDLKIQVFILMSQKIQT